MAKGSIGTVVQVIGPVLDIKFANGELPQLLNAIITRDQQYNETLEYIRRREEAGELLVIRPPQKLPIERTEKDPAVLWQVYEIGRKEAEARIREIQAFLDEPI